MFLKELYNHGGSPDIVFIETSPSRLYRTSYARNPNFISESIENTHVVKFRYDIAATNYNVLKNGLKTNAHIQGQGFISDDRYVKHGGWGKIRTRRHYVRDTLDGTIFDGTGINQTQMNHLYDMINLAKANKARVILFDTLMPYALIERQPEPYKLYIAHMKKLAKKLNVEHYDFSLMHDNVFPRFVPHSEYFRDTVHMNGTGAVAYAPIFSDFFNDVIMGSSENIGDYFFNSIDEIFLSDNFILWATENDIDLQ